MTNLLTNTTNQLQQSQDALNRSIQQLNLATESLRAQQAANYRFDSVTLDLTVYLLRTDPLFTNLFPELDALAKNPSIPSVPDGLDGVFYKGAEHYNNGSQDPFASVSVGLPLTNVTLGGEKINLTEKYRDFLTKFLPSLPPALEDVQSLAAPVVTLEFTSAVSNRTLRSVLNKSTNSERDLKITFDSYQTAPTLVYRLGSPLIELRWIFQAVTRQHWEGRGTIIGVSDLGHAHTTLRFGKSDSGLIGSGDGIDYEQYPRFQPWAVNLTFGTYQVNLASESEQRFVFPKPDADGGFNFDLPDTEDLVKPK
jgi:hypothetical protein